jgi:hypothetical protein
MADSFELLRVSINMFLLKEPSVYRRLFYAADRYRSCWLMDDSFDPPWRIEVCLNYINRKERKVSQRD